VNPAGLTYQPWPLKALPQELVTLLNRLSGRELRLGFSPDQAEAAEHMYICPDISRLASEYAPEYAPEYVLVSQDADEISLALKLESERWRIKANGLAVTRVLNAAKHILPEGIQAEELPRELRLAVFCFALEPCLQQASAALGLAVTLEDADTSTDSANAAPLAENTLKIPFDLKDDAGKLTGKGEADIPFSSSSLRMLLSISRSLPNKKNRIDDLKLPLSICAAQGSFALKLLHEVAAGDILLFEQAWRPDSCIAEICGQAAYQETYRAWQGNLTNGVFTLTAPLFNQTAGQTDQQADNWSDNRAKEADHNLTETMNKETSMDNQANDNVDINELEVRLTLELEERLISIRELSTLAPGYTFVTAASPENPVKLKVNGKVVGKGQMVDVGGRLGVLVSTLNLAETATE
jgi:type III secretion system YscQ/HrcQ family protein